MEQTSWYNGDTILLIFIIITLTLSHFLLNKIRINPKPINSCIQEMLPERLLQVQMNSYLLVNALRIIKTFNIVKNEEHILYMYVHIYIHVHIYIYIKYIYIHIIHVHIIYALNKCYFNSQCLLFFISYYISLLYINQNLKRNYIYTS